MLLSFFAYYFLKLHFSFLKDKKSSKSHKTEGIEVFFTIFVMDPDPGGQKNTDPISNNASVATVHISFLVRNTCI